MRTKEQPIRTCVGCGESAEKWELLRFVLDKNGKIVPDVSFKLPGRGAYLHPNRKCFELAKRRKGFARTYKANVEFDTEGAIEQTTTLLKKRAAELAGLCRRASLLVSGNNSVLYLLKERKPQVVFLAEDISDGMKKKFTRLLESIGVPVVHFWSKQQWGQVLGTSPRSVIAFLPGGLTDKFLLVVRKIKSLEARN